uniref:Phytol kinase n=1 Tax=Tetradesmus obliquus TaxID=3088 RepID=A0A383VFP1_TETOB|eukprot:jgi/Sobl393_1/5442/SZX64368.1
MVLLHDVWVMLATSSLPLGLVACTEALKDSNRLSAASARKFLHIVTGLAFMLTWPLYSDDPSARYLAAALPGAMALRFLLAGLGVTHEARLVAGTARTGQRQELLAGPMLYGLAHVALTLVAWRSSPASAAGLAALCAGDGAADVGGRLWAARMGGQAGRLPHNTAKTWAGSCCCLAAAFVSSLAYLCLFNSLGYYQQRWSVARLAQASLLSSWAAAALESLPGLQDNLVMPAGAGLAALLLVR